jgi:hypothetical protein
MKKDGVLVVGTWNLETTWNKEQMGDLGFAHVVTIPNISSSEVSEQSPVPQK